MSGISVIDPCVMQMKGATFSLTFLSDKSDYPPLVAIAAEIQTDMQHGNFKITSDRASELDNTFAKLADYLDRHLLRLRTYGHLFDHPENVGAPYVFTPLELTFQLDAQSGGTWEENGEIYGSFDVRAMVNLRKPNDQGTESVFVGVESSIELQACAQFIEQLRAVAKHIKTLRGEDNSA